MGRVQILPQSQMDGYGRATRRVDSEESHLVGQAAPREEQRGRLASPRRTRTWLPDTRRPATISQRTTTRVHVDILCESKMFSCRVLRPAYDNIESTADRGIASTTMAHSDALQVDAVIVGAGPVGTLIAYQLARFGCTPYLMEQENKATLPHYGRATTMWPRTIELLDQLDLADRLMQIGVVTRNALHFRDGRRSEGGLMFGSRMDQLGDTFYKFSLHLRQRLTEEQFTEALEEHGFGQNRRTSIDGFTIDEDSLDGYPVTVRARDLEKDEVFEIKTKFLIGADGGKSTVRSLAGIPFAGERTTNRWIRMDARVKTNMPNPRCLNSIDSKYHGQILWCPIDNGLTRIGYVFSQALLEKYGGLEGVTQEVAVKEAIQALQPFEVEFLEVDWFTIYGIGQAIAETFSVDDRIFLAGDACHTHSSGSAQGLNTGVQDAVNISWKLALYILGLGKKSLIESYTAERKPSVQQVIEYDKVISTLISEQYPPRFEGRKEHPHDILTEWYRDGNVRLFTLGLGISYPTNLINSTRSDPSAATITPGERGPDVFLATIGTSDPIRLHSVLKNEAKFHSVIFTGNPALTRPALRSLHSALGSPTSFINTFPARRVFRFTTLAAGSGNGAADVLGVPGFGPGGRTFWDPEGRAHAMYGVDEGRGAVIVFRPDGWVGCVVGLEGVLELGAYFEEILVRK
ncbi:FAD binding domain-containing protein [Roridomyces roridus]|uniref:FAD binding domain-containing protein n=1 Tax=Roridomyces roridus TaxID=1738132 RepID=A0AAD7FZ37_9AGAR|nr:FAD binding domain-containing protein [Roridomyces roridus]